VTTPVLTFVLDTGALIALERADRRLTALLVQVRAGQARVVVPDAVLAQVWRGGSGRQARISALLGLGPQRCTSVPLDTAAAKRIGTAISESGHRDVVDVHVAVVATDLGDAAVITSDRADLVAAHPPLVSRIVDI
jgi:predicted nucleic acid-binding protein